MTTYKICFFYRRKFRPPSNEPPEGIKEVFRQYAGGGEIMSPDRFRHFIEQVQGETNTAAAAAAQKYGSLFHKKGSLTLDEFFRYLFSTEDNPPLSPHLGIHQEMTAPISHYFIYTGHNSYLTGNQLSSYCSELPIISALKRGVRVIELDLWPNSVKDDVHVLHGRTLTAPVELIKCFNAIKANAFTASPYPVIITLEDHLTPDLQTKVAKMITETFGEMLYHPMSESVEEFPSPEELKMRIIISTRLPKEYLESKSIKEKSYVISQKGAEEDDAWGAEIDQPTVAPTLAKKEEEDQSKHFHEEEEDEEDHDDADRRTQPHEYKRLITISAKKRKPKINESLEIDPQQVTRLSLNETSLAKAATSHRNELLRFTQRNILRVFPKAMRINSSNYDPLLAWMYGAQMVALNMQGYGRELWLMQGMFRANGGCGYVKKPDFLLNNGHFFDPKAPMVVQKTLKVRVYMGDGWRFDFRHTHFDRFSPPDFYTKVGIAGVPTDTVMKKTKVIEDNWAPFWDEEFVFRLTVPELALLRIEVHEYDISKRDDFGGQTCLPVSELKSGIRAVPLYDRKGDKLKSVKLLMRFDFS